MSKLKVLLPGGAIATTGLQVSFIAPCDCSGVTHLVIDDIEYQIVDAMANPTSGAKNMWCRDALVSVLLDTARCSAYILNAASLCTAVPEHKHNYAGSDTAGGSATSAEKLTTNAGDVDTPVFFRDGVPTPCESVDMNATTASKLETPILLQVDLASSAGVNFDGSGPVSPGVKSILPTKHGGTGSSNGATGLKNLLAAGPTILSSHQYGDALPTNPAVGQLFFLDADAADELGL